jgi:crossover junction endodeoxyribonuclease RuvC
MSKTVVVGIDPSLTGTAVCVAGNNPERFSSVPAEGLRGRMLRFITLANTVVNAVPLNARVMLEDYSFGSRGDAVTNLAEYGGILRMKLLEITPDVVEVTPSQLKKFATGKGNADKTAIAVAAFKRWGIEFATSDETDAFVLAQIGLCYSGQQEPDNAAQREVIETLRNGPVKKKRKVKA